MRKKYTSFIICTWVFISICSHALTQPVGSNTDFNRIVPPAPEAAGIQRQIKIPVNYSTGVANISIPIYEIQTSFTTIPITLNYHASGIKVDQLSSSVGLGWSLSAGGGIYRTVRGYPDEINSGALTNSRTAHFAATMNAEGTVNANDAFISFGHDFTQDDYSYNFGGFSGSFYYDSTGTIRQVIKDPMELSTQGWLFDYIARDYGGNRYYFDSSDIGYYVNRNTSNPNPEPMVTYTGAWLLTKIKHQQADSVMFDYETYFTNYELQTTDIHDRLVQFLGCTPGGPGCITCGDDAATNTYHLKTQYSNYNKLVKQILTTDVKVDFYYSNESGADVWQRKLDSVVVTSLADNQVKKSIHLVYEVFNGNNQLKLSAVKKRDIITGNAEVTRLQYYESVVYSLPGLNSRSKDIFGYFNGRSNQFLITSSDIDYPYANADRTITPQTIHLGSLKKMIHTTGGYTEFVYEPNQVGTNTYAPGIRVKEIIEYNGVNNILNISAYEYHKYLGASQTFPIDMVPEIRDASYRRKVFSSNPKTGSFLISLSSLHPVGYSYDSVVVSSKGNNYDLKTSYLYDNHLVLNSLRPYIKEIKQYKYDTTNATYSVVQKEINTYSHEIVPGHTTPILDVMPANLTLYTIFTNPSPAAVNCTVYSPGLYIGDGFDVNVIQKTRTELTNYENGNAITTATNYYYQNAAHGQPTRIVNYTSTDSVITQIKYPHEMVSGGLDPNGTYQVMLYLYMYAPKIIEELLDAQNNPLSKTIVSYAHSYVTGLASVYQILQGYKGNTPVALKTISHYDTKGNILEYEEHDLKNAIIWDYNNMLPAARIVNGLYNESAYTGFETNSTGNWIIYGGTVNSGTSLMGKKSYTFNGGASVNKSSLNNKNYIVSYWSQGGSLSVNITSGTAGNTKNGWTYYEHKLSSVANITIIGSATIDELRLYEENAQMSTYNYTPLLGMTDNSDANSNILHYEYDGLGRLAHVRDVENNILKKYGYSITQLTGPGVYYNTAQVGAYDRNNCPTGYEPWVTYYYSVPAGTYSSTISVNDANDQALHEINTLGQLYANKFGLCQPINTCPGCNPPRRRCINNVCVIGAKVYTSSVYNPLTGFYDCTYHYEWPDGFWSSEYTEESANPCPDF